MLDRLLLESAGRACRTFGQPWSLAHAEWLEGWFRKRSSLAEVEPIRNIGGNRGGRGLMARLASPRWSGFELDGLAINCGDDPRVVLDWRSRQGSATVGENSMARMTKRSTRQIVGEGQAG